METTSAQPDSSPGIQMANSVIYKAGYGVSFWHIRLVNCLNSVNTVLCLIIVKFLQTFDTNAYCIGIPRSE